MNTISHYHLAIGKSPNVRRMAVTPLEVQKTLDGSMLAPGEWTVTTVYQDGHDDETDASDLPF